MTADHWRKASLGDLANLRIGRTPPRKDSRYWTDDLTHPFCTIADMTDRLVRPSREGVTQVAIDDGKARLVPAGTLLMSFKLTIGRVGFAATNLFPNEAIVAIDPNALLASPAFLYYLLGSQDLTTDSNRAAKGATLNSKSLAAIEVLLPSIDEQQRIVDLIESVDSYIDALRVQAAAARAARASFLNELLNAGGEDWIEGVLGDFAEASWGNTEITKKSYTNSGYTAYSATGPDGLVDWYEHESEGVVLSAIGAQCGKTWLASGRWTPIKNTIWFKATSGTTSNFLFLVTGRTEVWPRRGQAQPFIALSDVRSLPIQLPPPEEQQRIVDLIQTVDDTIVAADVAIDGAVALRSGLLADLLSGDHEIPESYDALLEAS